MILRSKSVIAICVVSLFSVLSVIAVWSAHGALAAGNASGPVKLAVVAPVLDCSKLSSEDIDSAVGSPTHLTSATAVPDGKPAPYCDVTGYVEPQVKFEVRLPLAAWTQRFLQTGCGGLCGNLGIRVSNDHDCMPAQNGELALASTDMGHSGQADGSFGEKEFQLRIDFAYRGVHVTTLAAKALIERFYGQKPKYSYFAGCSDGGREALMEAQRYPEDFNGILAGAPAMNFVTQNTFYHGWNARTNTGADGKPILTADKLPILHQAIVAKCDAGDGLKDGIISDPIACHFDPSVTLCKPGQDVSTCLTSAEVNVAKEIYAGAHDSDGNKLVLSGPLPGSELAWAGVYIPRSGSDQLFSAQIATGTLKYLAYEKNPPADYSLADLKFDRSSFAAATKLHFLYDSTDPDLSTFASGGGKLILWHGFADQHISPLNTIAYYTAMERVMGKSAVEKFARAYLFPGGYHCAGGEGPFNVDLLSAIMGWVESRDAPQGLIASHTTDGGKVDSTRPVYPYPLTTKYTGSGDINDAKNFVAGSPEPVPADKLNWLGSSFYSTHYEQWCSGSGTSMTCKPTR